MVEPVETTSTKSVVPEAFIHSTPVLSSPAQGKLYTEDDFDALIPKIDFTWNKVDGAKSYKFVIKDSKGKVLLDKTVSTNKYTLSSNNLSLVSDNGEYTWSVTAVQTVNKQEYTTQAAERTFKVQMEDAETATLKIDNLVTF